MMALRLELEVAEINTILRALGRQPFDDVVTLISKIKKQGDDQVAQQAKVIETLKPDTED
mgnify:CR=1 FL=1|jgi:hypothetical protein